MPMRDWFAGFWGADRATVLETTTATAILAADTARQRGYADAWDAYNGVFPDPLKPAKDGEKDRVVVNRCKRIVDTTTYFLFGQPLGWDLPAPDEAPEQETLGETWLTETLRQIGWAAFLLDLRTNGGVCGTAYARTLPLDKTHRYPRVQALNPSEMTIRWDPRDHDVVRAYVQEFNSVDEATRRPIVVRQTTRRAGPIWEVVDEHRFLGSPGDAWIGEGTTPWAHAWPPIAHCKNLPAPNQVYGDPDLSDNLIELNESRNLNLSNRQRVDRLQGHPYIYATGMAPNSKLDLAPDRLNVLPGEQAKLNQLAPEIHAEAAERLGWELEAALCEESATPALALGRQQEHQLASGTALRLGFLPLEAKIAVMRVLYGPLLVEVIRRLAELGGQRPNCLVSLTWPEIIPTNPLEEREALAVEQAMGTISRATIAGALRRDWTQEQENRQAEQVLDPAPSAVEAAKDPNFRVRAETAHPIR